MLTHERLKELTGGKLYSGRGMMGRQCWSVTTEDGQTPFKLLSDIILDCDDVNEASELLRRAHTDDMGRETIIYWPSIKAPETETTS